MCLRILLVFIFLLQLSLNARAQSSYNEKELQISLRMVGDQMLLRSGDSSSRVLPIEKDSNTYRLSFQNEFALHPDDLIFIVDSIMALRDFVQAYVVEIEHCNSMEVVYSYAVSGVDSSNLISCRGRALPKDCYKVLFTLKKTPVFSSELVNLYESTDEKRAENNSMLIYYLLPLFIVFGFIGLYFFRKKGSEKNEHQITLGRYKFDTNRSELILQEQKIELSSKEADLLILFHQSLNDTLERDVILNKVWGDEGDYVGRTLDVFISKLRKKLEGDPDIKIVNVRGVGYKLIVGNS